MKRLAAQIKTQFNWIFFIPSSGVIKNRFNEQTVGFVPAPMKSQTLHEKTMDINEKLVQNSITTDQNPVDFKIYRKSLYKLVLTDLIKCTILKIIVAFSILGNAIILKQYLKIIKKPGFDFQDSLPDVFAFTAITFVSGIINEHAGKFTCVIKAKLGQSLRGMFFQRILKANPTFLSESDSSFISKMILDELGGIVNYIGFIPDLVVLPFQLAFSLTFMYIFLGVLTNFMYIVIGISLTLLVILNKKIIKLRTQYNLVTAKKIDLVRSVIENIKTIKINNEEAYFKKKLKDYRAQEIAANKKTSLLESFVSLIVSITPTFSAFLLIALYPPIEDKVIEASTLFSIITLLNSLKKPLMKVTFFINITASYATSNHVFKIFYQNIIQVDDPKFSPMKIKQIVPLVDESSNLNDSNLGNSSNRNAKLSDNEKKLNKEAKKLKQRTGLAFDMQECVLTSESIEKIQTVIGLIYLQDGDSHRQKQQTLKEFIDEHQSNYKNKSQLNSVTLMQLYNKQGQSQGSLGSPLKKVSEDAKLNIENFQKKSKVEKLQNNLRESAKEIKLTFKKSVTDITETVKKIVKTNKVQQELLKIKRAQRLIEFEDMSVKIPDKGLISIIGVNQHDVNLFCEILTKNLCLEAGIYKENPNIILTDLTNPLIFPNLSLRENIILEEKFKYKKFINLTKAVGLDIYSFPQKDNTLVTSENQSVQTKRKIVLARLLYRTKEQVFIINDGIKLLLESELEMIKVRLGHKCVIFGTTDKRYIQKSKYMVWLQGRDVIEHGYVKELSKDPQSKLSIYQTRNIVSLRKNPFKQIFKDVKEQGDRNKEEAVKYFQQGVKIEKPYSESFFRGYKIYKNISSIQKQKTEARSDVQVRYASFTKRFLLLGGKGYLVLQFLVFLISIILLVSIDVYIGLMSSQKRMGDDDYIILSSLILLTAIFIFIRDLSYHKLNSRNSNMMAETTMDKIFQTNFYFYQQRNPMEVAFSLNQCQKQIDSKFDSSSLGLAQSFFIVAMAILIINLLYYGVMLIPSVILIFIIWKLLSKYLSAIYQMTKLKKLCYSKLFNSMNFHLEYAQQIRSLSSKALHWRLFSYHNDKYQKSAGNIGNASSRYLFIRMTLIETAVSFVVFLTPSLIVKYGEGVILGQLWQVALVQIWSKKLLGGLRSFSKSSASLVQDSLNIDGIFTFNDHKQIEPQLSTTTLPDPDKKYTKKQLMAMEILPEVITGDIDPYRKIEYFDKQNDVEIKNIQILFEKEVKLSVDNLKIMKNSNVAIMGKEGCGKNLLLNLVAGIYSQSNFDESESHVVVLQKKIMDWKIDVLRDQMAYLPTKAYLFPGTIRSNINTERLYSDQEIVKVLHFLKAHEIFKLEEDEEEEDQKHQKFLNPGTLGAMFSKQMAFDKIKEPSKEPSQGQSFINIEIDSNRMQDSGLWSPDKPSAKTGINSNITSSIKEKKSKFTKTSTNDFQPSLLNSNRNDSLSEKNLKSQRNNYNKVKAKIDLLEQAEEEYSEECCGHQKLDHLNHQIEDKSIDNQLKLLAFLDMPVTVQEKIYAPLKRIVMIARVLLQKPKILLMDEYALTFDQLDSSFYINSVLNGLPNSTILSVIRNVETVHKYDRIVYMHQGKIIEDSTPEAVMQNEESLIRIFIRNQNLAHFSYLKNQFKVARDIQDYINYMLKQREETLKQINSKLGQVKGKGSNGGFFGMFSGNNNELDSEEEKRKQELAKEEALRLAEQKKKQRKIKQMVLGKFESEESVLEEEQEASSIKQGRLVQKVYYDTEQLSFDDFQNQEQQSQGYKQKSD